MMMGPRYSTRNTVRHAICGPTRLSYVILWEIKLGRFQKTAHLSLSRKQCFDPSALFVRLTPPGYLG